MVVEDHIKTYQHNEWEIIMGRGREESLLDWIHRNVNNQVKKQGNKNRLGNKESDFMTHMLKTWSS